MSNNLEGANIWNDSNDAIDKKTSAMSIAELRQCIQLINNEIHIFRSNIQCINHKGRGQRERNRENIEKVKLNKQLPYLLGNVIKVLKPKTEDGLDDEDKKEGSATDVNTQHKTRSKVIHGAGTCGREGAEVLQPCGHKQGLVLDTQEAFR
jgi:26S proteasome regulatory subunit T5